MNERWKASLAGFITPLSTAAAAAAAADNDDGDDDDASLNP